MAIKASLAAATASLICAPCARLGHPHPIRAAHPLFCDCCVLLIALPSWALALHPFHAKMGRLLLAMKDKRRPRSFLRLRRRASFKIFIFCCRGGDERHRRCAVCAAGRLHFTVARWHRALHRDGDFRQQSAAKQSLLGARFMAPWLVNTGTESAFRRHFPQLWLFLMGGALHRCSDASSRMELRASGTLVQHPASASVQTLRPDHHPEPEAVIALRDRKSGVRPSSSHKEWEA